MSSDRDRDRELERFLGRREFLALGGAAGAAVLLAGCGGAGAATASTARRAVAAGRPPVSKEPGNLKIYDYAGYDAKPLWAGYHKQFPHDHPTWKYLNSDAEALSTAIAGYRADVVHPCVGFVKDWAQSGLVQPWNTKLIPNFENLNPSLVKAGQVNGKQYMVPSDWGFISVMYRSDKVHPQEMSWNLLFDKRYAGKITWYDNPQDMLFIGGFAIGAKNPFDMTTDELAEVKAKFIGAKRYVRNFWNSQTAMENDFAAGNVWITYAWPSSWVLMRKKGLKVAYMNPKEGRLAFLCGFSLFAGTKNYFHAHDYVNAWVSPQAGQWLLNNYAYGSSNMKVDLKKVKPELVNAFQLRNPKSIREPKVHVLRYNPKRTTYDKVWQEIKAA